MNTNLNSLGPIIIVGLIVIFFIYIFRTLVPHDEIIEEPNPEYLNLITEGRNNFINELLEHLRLNLMLSEDAVKNCTSELVGVDINRFVVADGDRIITIIIKWNRSVSIHFFYNQDIAGEIVVNRHLTLKMRDNLVDWKKIAKFSNKIMDKYFPLADEEAFTSIVQTAKQVAEQVDEKAAREFLFSYLEETPWDGSKIHPKKALHEYTKLMAYVLKFHAEEFVAFLKANEEKKEETQD